MSGLAQIRCHIPSGIVLRTYVVSPGPWGTTSVFPADSVTLKEGDNDVDSGFYEQWVQASPDSFLIQNRLIERIN